ncbi:hypothetical protein AXF13_03610 [Desulfovibrio fairfieldensis]|uniref:Uncharacterized protein n=1 Tax=Desulfovibrio fairfieldensis TaxID=44742 RepID=A0A0X8JI78_9BACT|nr:hypothetical protein AXF13_03610 [Desulfovibrio fairfieldensis]
MAFPLTNNMRVRILIRAVLLTDDGDGRIHLVLGDSVWFVPSFSPESTVLRQDVVPFKIPDEIFVENGDGIG